MKKKHFYNKRKILYFCFLSQLEMYSQFWNEPRPDFAMLDVFLDILIHKFNLDHFPTSKPNLNHE